MFKSILGLGVISLACFPFVLAENKIPISAYLAVVP